jgi:hypothetical protein
MIDQDSTSHQSNNDKDIYDNGHCVRVGPEIPIDWEELKKDLPLSTESSE